jgi:hypothetical protein
MPWDSAYEASASAARAKYQNALAALGYNRTSLQQDYGLDAGFNDYKANPYSRAAELQNSYERANRASQTSMGAAGHLYSGSTQNQLTYNAVSKDRGYNDLRTAYQNALQEIRNKELGAGDEMNEALANAMWQRVEAAQSQPLDPTVVAGPAPAPAGRGSYAKSKKHGKYGIGKGRRA